MGRPRILRPEFDRVDLVPGQIIPYRWVVNPANAAEVNERIIRDIVGPEAQAAARRAAAEQAEEDEAKWQEWLAAGRPRLPGLRYLADLAPEELPTLLAPEQWDEIEAATGGEQLDLDVAALRADLLAFRAAPATEVTNIAHRVAVQILGRVAHEKLAPGLRLFAGRVMNWLDAHRDVEKLPGLLTPGQWYAIARADEDGPLPRCCPAISGFRDELLGFLRTPTALGARDITRALLDGTAGCGDLHSPALLRFARRVERWLDANEPGWRIAEGPTDEELDAFDLRMRIQDTLQGSDPRWEARPRRDWDTRLALVIDRLFIDITPLPEDRLVAWRDSVRGALADLYAAGAPIPVIRALYDVMMGLLRDAFRAQEAPRG